MATPAKKKVLLREGMKFYDIVRTSKRGSRRKKYVGPCEVEMTDDQIKSFKDLLQTAPQVVVSEPVESVPDDESTDSEPDLELTQA